MYAATSSSKAASLPGLTWTSSNADLPRAQGCVDIGFRRRGDRTVLRDLYQQGSGKVRFPKVFNGGPPEAVLINLAGGLTGGDCFRQTVDLEEGAHALVTTQAAEKIYRASDGAEPARISNKITVKAAALEWLPQETIFFDGGRLHRSFEATLTEDARLLACEAIVFGRTAMGETVEQGFFRDDWRITIGDRLAYADGFMVDGSIQDYLDRPAIARGHRALASVLYVGANAERLLAPARSAIDDDEKPDGMAAVSCRDRVMLARFLAADGRVLRSMLSRYIQTLRAAAGLEGGLPKLWHC